MHTFKIMIVYGSIYGSETRTFNGSTSGAMEQARAWLDTSPTAIEVDHCVVMTEHGTLIKVVER